MSLTREKRSSLFGTASTSYTSPFASSSSNSTMVEDDGGETVYSDRIRKQIEERDRLIQSARQSSIRSLQMTEQSIETGIETMVQLDRQGEQIRNASDRLDSLEGTLALGERYMKSIGSWTGMITNAWTKDRSSQQLAAARESTSRVRAREHEAVEREYATKRNNQTQNDNSSYWTKMTSVLSPPSWWGAPSEQEKASSSPSSRLKDLVVDPEAKAFFEESDRHLDQLSSRLDTLQALAMDMGQELDVQNRELSRLEQKVEKNTARLFKDTRTIKSYS